MHKTWSVHARPQLKPPAMIKLYVMRPCVTFSKDLTSLVTCGATPLLADQLRVISLSPKAKASCFVYMPARRVLIPVLIQHSFSKR